MDPVSTAVGAMGGAVTMLAGAVVFMAKRHAPAHHSLALQQPVSVQSIADRDKTLVEVKLMLDNVAKRVESIASRSHEMAGGVMALKSEVHVPLSGVQRSLDRIERMMEKVLERP